jgi:hypothetical protein
MAMRGGWRVMWAPMVLVAALLLFAAASWRLAAINQSPGSPDSRENLIIARAVAQGQGLQTWVASDHLWALPVPHEPTHRRPGLPLLMSLLFRAGDVSLAYPVLLNAFTVIATILVLTAALAMAGTGVFAFLGPLLLLASCNYEMISLWDNNLLTLMVSIWLLLGVLLLRQRITPRAFAVLAGLTGAVAFLLKPTSIVTIGPLTFGMLLLAPPGDWRANGRRAILLAALAMTILAVLTAPYWGRNLMRHGKLLYSCQPELRLSERYGGLPGGTLQTVRYGQPVTYAEMATVHGGWAGLARRELQVWYLGLKTAIGLNPLLVALAGIGALLTCRRSTLGWYALGLLAMTADFLFPTFYFAVEDRYYWPLAPALILLTGVALRELATQHILATPIRGRILLTLWLTAAALYGARYGNLRWREAFTQARRPPPSWVAAIAALPPDAPILTNDPWTLAWHVPRPAVLSPIGSREDLLAVLRVHHPRYLLCADYNWRVLPLRRSELLPLASSRTPGQRWDLYEIRLQAPPTP